MTNKERKLLSFREELVLTTHEKARESGLYLEDLIEELCVMMEMLEKAYENKLSPRGRTKLV